MGDRRNCCDDDDDISPGHAGESTLESPGEVVVTHHPAPPKSRPDKEIHPRRPLRPVPPGPPREDEENNAQD